jgi:hypothetical protein
MAGSVASNEVPGDFFLGVDVGSTTVKVVCVDPASREILWSDYQRHETRQAEKLLELLEEVERRFPDVARGGTRALVTGSGAKHLVLRQPHLDHALVDRGARAAGALVVEGEGGDPDEGRGCPPATRYARPLPLHAPKAPRLHKANRRAHPAPTRPNLATLLPTKEKGQAL